MNCSNFPPVARMNQATSYTLVLSNVFTAISGVFINLCFVVGIFSKEALLTTTNTLVASLSISDLLVGLIGQPMFLAHLLLNGQSCIVGDITFATVGVFCGASSLCLPLVSLDRYIRMKKLQYYSRYVTKKRVASVLCLAWVNAIIIAFMPMYGVSLVVFYSMLIAYLLVIAFTMMAAYISVIGRSRRKVAANTPHTTSTHQPVNPAIESGTMEASLSEIAKVKKRLEIEHSRQLKLTVTVTMLVAVVVLSWLPTFVVGLLWALWVPTSNSSSTMVTLYYVTSSIGFAASTINPLLYCWRIREIRRAAVGVMWKILRCGRQYN